MKKILYYGGQKSGKSLLAEKKTLNLATSTPYYIATYNNAYEDKEMQRRISKHQSQRQENFITIEEPLDLTKIITPNNTYLIDCISMWILNTLDKTEEELLSQLSTITQIESNIVFVLNDVTTGVIPMDRESRKFVDRTGIVGQYLSKISDEVYEAKFGIEIKIKE